VTIRKSLLNFSNVNPTIDELEMFKICTDNMLDESDGEDEQLVADCILNAIEERDRLKMVPGDTVKIIAGHFKNLNAEILEVLKDKMLLLKPDGFAKGINCEVSIDQVVKTFEKNQQVIVTDGQFKNQVGVVGSQNGTMTGVMFGAN